MKELIMVFAVFLITGCSFTNQPIERIAMLNRGMSKQSVLSTMGSPIKSEFSGDMTAWHYCRTGGTQDDYVVLLFNGDSLHEAKNYSLNRETGGGFGDCSKFVQPVNFRAPDTVNEIRVR